MNFRTALKLKMKTVSFCPSFNEKVRERPFRRYQICIGLGGVRFMIGSSKYHQFFNLWCKPLSILNKLELPHRGKCDIAKNNYINEKKLEVNFIFKMVTAQNETVPKAESRV